MPEKEIAVVLNANLLSVFAAIKINRSKWSKNRLRLGAVFIWSPVLGNQSKLGSVTL